MDDVLEAISDRDYEKERCSPYWAETWPSASAMFRFIMGSGFPDTCAAIELGCGLGVISSALCARGLFTVSADIAYQACCFAAFNITRNNGAAKVVCADMCESPFRRKFDLAVASDILYEERLIDPLLDCIRDLLVPDGRALIADPCRRFWNRFKERAAEKEFSLELLDSISGDCGARTIEIVQLTDLS